VGRLRLPGNLLGEAIPVTARILAVADAVSAMTTDRPYRKSLGWETTLAEIRKGSGTQLDPKMAEAFLRAVEKRRPDRVPRKWTSPPNHPPLRWGVGANRRSLALEGERSAC